ncbi:hypothetical protein [Streptomyces sp. NRRL S-475]|uniref:hypothetical protein n=1 Tax=Streptomyces sp. NRRL S-475 TaxID=1463910 RepID=UPI00131E5028|nr:hypothetical protein [Streptomyces sp. NRRL S-475]
MRNKEEAFSSFELAAFATSELVPVIKERSRGNQCTQSVSPPQYNKRRTKWRAATQSKPIVLNQSTIPPPWFPPHCFPYPHLMFGISNIKLWDAGLNQLPTDIIEAGPAHTHKWIAGIHGRKRLRGLQVDL